MASYFLTFRVDETTRGYDAWKRRQSIETAVDDMSSNKWEGPTSFIIFETPSTDINSVLASIVAGLDEKVDVIFLRRVGYKTSRAWGAIPDSEWTAIKAMVEDAEFVTFSG